MLFRSGTTTWKITPRTSCIHTLTLGKPPIASHISTLQIYCYAPFPYTESILTYIQNLIDVINNHISQPYTAVQTSHTQPHRPTIHSRMRQVYTPFPTNHCERQRANTPPNTLLFERSEQMYTSLAERGDLEAIKNSLLKKS